jgi:hypothetical protein
MQVAKSAGNGITDVVKNQECPWQNETKNRNKKNISFM